MFNRNLLAAFVAALTSSAGASQQIANTPAAVNSVISHAIDIVMIFLVFGILFYRQK